MRPVPVVPDVPLDPVVVPVVVAPDVVDGASQEQPLAMSQPSPKATHASQLQPVLPLLPVVAVEVVGVVHVQVTASQLRPELMQAVQQFPVVPVLPLELVAAALVAPLELVAAAAGVPLLAVEGVPLLAATGVPLLAVEGVPLLAVTVLLPVVPPLPLFEVTEPVAVAAVPPAPEEAPMTPEPNSSHTPTSQTCAPMHWLQALPLMPQ